MQNAINLELDIQHAVKNKQNILIMVYIEDCHYCHLLRDQVLEPMSKNNDYQNLIIKQVDARSSNDLISFNRDKINGIKFSSNYNIDFYPTVLLFNNKKVLLEKIIGIPNIDFYWHNLDKILAKYS